MKIAEQTNWMCFWDNKSKVKIV